MTDSGHTPDERGGRAGNTWATRDPETGRHHRNAHLLELAETDWRCLICGHYFDAAADADLFACGDSCAGKHPGDSREAS